MSADWVTAAVTALALIPAAFSILLDGRERRREQASRVTAWLDLPGRCVVVRNDGDHALRYLVVAMYVPGFRHDFYEPESEHLGWASEWVRPRSELCFPVEDECVDLNADLYPPEIRFEFTDLAGRRWRHSENGSLRRVFGHPRWWFARFSKVERATRRVRAVDTEWQG